MAQSQLEREDKYDVDPGYVLPDVSGLLPAGGRLEVGSEQLRSDYYDTADRALFQAGLTLRRRSGTYDNGWQLKVPAGAAREEVSVPLGSGDSVPDELRQLLLGITRGGPLAQIASLSTERATHRLFDGHATLLVEIADDNVHASATGDGATLSSWREVEVELKAGDETLLKALGKQLRRAGAQRSASGSKLARALPAPSVDPPTAGAGKARAGQVVEVYILEQQRMLLVGDLAIRRDDASVIHKTRVATRRLRSTLRIFGDLFLSERAAALDAELRWLAGLLGEVRDRQVLRPRLLELVDELPEEMILGPVRARIEAELAHEQAECWRELQQQLNSARYLDLLSDIASWVQNPPWTAQAHDRAATLVALLNDSERKVARKLARGNQTGDVGLLHSARKAAKRARYAAELAEPVIGVKPAHAQADRYQRLQDLLGEHQDSLVAADVLRRLGSKAGTTEGENGFTFGILHERELARSAAARVQAQKIARKYRTD